MQELRREEIKISEGFTIPITLNSDTEADGLFYFVEIDHVRWFITINRTHAIVLFEMMKDHITEYMHYEKIK